MPWHALQAMPALPCRPWPACMPCLPTPRNPEGELSSQWLILPSRLHSCLPAGSCPPCRPFMTAPSNHHPADDAERISSICGACMIDRRRHHAHAAAAHGPLRARRAGGRRLSRMRHWKGHVPCSAVGAGECGGWHTTTARAVCARRRSQESAARRLSLHGPCWGSGGLAQAIETGLNSKLSNSDHTYGSTDLRLPYLNLLRYSIQSNLIVYLLQKITCYIYMKKGKSTEMRG